VTRHYTAEETAHLLPYPALAERIREALLERARAQVPERLSVALSAQGVLLAMPAADPELAMTKLVTVHPENAARGLPTIQGEVIAIDARTGVRLGVLEGATVTGRRTAALSLLAAQTLAPAPEGALLVVGAGVQARAHVEAFRAGLGTQRVVIASRTPARAEALAVHARDLGMRAEVLGDPHEAFGRVSLVVTATTSDRPVLRRPLPADVMVCAVGAFRPAMAELEGELIAGASVVVDTLEGARSEAGDLIQAAEAGVWSWERAVALEAVLAGRHRPAGPVVFKSVGHALFDLAACHLAFGR
jgi:1-piperideine-2-carboxylate/1-pyrroline-2-carboxylate reductase [NAD(P)H]